MNKEETHGESIQRSGIPLLARNPMQSRMGAEPRERLSNVHIRRRDAGDVVRLHRLSACHRANLEAKPRFDEGV